MKLTNFITELNETLNSVHPTWFADNVTGIIKDRVGDSLNNNRVPSVNQVIRFLTRENSSTRQYEIGRTLRQIYNATRRTLRQNRSTLRTDAFDINEFTGNVETVVVNTSLSRKVNSLLG